MTATAETNQRVVVAYLDRRWSARGELDGYAQYPADVELIVAALRELGMRAEALDVGPDPALLERSARPGDIVFNYVERVSGPRGTSPWYVSEVAAKLGLPYLGPTTETLALVTDKAAAKARCAEHLATPRGLFLEEPWANGGGLPLAMAAPLIVKPNFEAGSRGISDDFVVDTPSEAPEKIAEQLLRFPEGVLVEEFVAGEDVTVAFLECSGAYSCLPPVLYRPERLRRSARSMYDYEAKNAPEARAAQLRGVHAECPAALPGSTVEELEAATISAAAALGVRAFGRVDFRLSEGRPWFLEMNALPDLDATGGFGISCAAMKLPLRSVIRSIVESHGLSACRTAGQCDAL